MNAAAEYPTFELPAWVQGVAFVAFVVAVLGVCWLVSSLSLWLGRGRR